MLDEPILEMLFQLLPELWTDWKILRKDGDHPAVFRKVGWEDIKDFSDCLTTEDKVSPIF